MAERRRTFGPVVLLGLASAGLAAVAGHQPWLDLRSQDADPAAWREMLAGMGLAVGEVPLAGASALVALACWGVVLVTRGRARRAVAALGALAGAGVVAAWAAAAGSLLARARETLSASGFSPDVDGDHTLWFYAAPVAGLLTALAAAAAVRLAPEWPEMGRRYDAPGASGAPAADALDGEHNLDLWKALDQGHDPTSGTEPERGP